MCKGLRDPAKGQGKLSGSVFFKEQQTQYNVPHSDEEYGTMRKMQKWLKQ